MAPEPGRKQEVGNSHGGVEKRRDGGSDGGARGGRQSERQTDLEAVLVPRLPLRSYTRPGPQAGLHWPYRSRQAKARNAEGRQGGVVWAPRSPPRARRGSGCPQGPAAREPVGVGE